MALDGSHTISVAASAVLPAGWINVVGSNWMKRAKITMACILALILGLALTFEKAEVAIPEAAAQVQKKEVQPKLVPENLARGKKVSASSQQDDARGPDKGVDGDFDTRWCAASGAPTQWYLIDLG